MLTDDITILYTMNFFFILVMTVGFVYLLKLKQKINHIENLISDFGVISNNDYIKRISKFLSIDDIAIDFTVDERAPSIHKLISNKKKNYNKKFKISQYSILFISFFILLLANATSCETKVTSESNIRHEIKELRVELLKQNNEMEKILTSIKCSDITKYKKDSVVIKMKTWIDIHNYNNIWLKEDSLLYVKGDLAEKEMKRILLHTKKQQDSLLNLTYKIINKSPI